jgi:hypothetical protein
MNNIGESSSLNFDPNRDYLGEQTKDNETDESTETETDELVLEKGYMLKNDPRWQDKDFVIKLVKRNPNSLDYAPEEVRADRAVALTALLVPERGWTAVDNLPTELRSDRDIGLYLVKQSGWALKYLPELQDDRDVVLAAVKQRGDAFKLASQELRADQEILREALTTGLSDPLHASLSASEILDHAAPELREKSEFLELVKNRRLS